MTDRSPLTTITDQNQMNNILSIDALLMAETARDSQDDWRNHRMPIRDLLVRINRASAQLLKDGEYKNEGDGRVRKSLSERSFRHYQTLGYISAPFKFGRRAVYGRHHFLQALLIRKLLLCRLTSLQVATVMRGKSSDDIRRLLVTTPDLMTWVGREKARHRRAAPAKQPDTWRRIRLASGVEIHIRAELPAIKQAEVKRLTEVFESVLRQHRP
jgi:hypothetical protein